jgi:hypothetical protein
MPALFRVVIHIKHVVGKNGAESQSGIDWMIFELFSFFKCDFHHDLVFIISVSGDKTMFQGVLFRVPFDRVE